MGYCVEELDVSRDASQKKIVYKIIELMIHYDILRFDITIENNDAVIVNNACLDFVIEHIEVTPDSVKNSSPSPGLCIVVIVNKTMTSL